MLLSGQSRPLEMVVYAGCIVSLGTNCERTTEALSLTQTALLSLWTKTGDQPDVANSLATALRNVSSLFGSDTSELADWGNEAVQYGLQSLFGVFEQFLPRFARSPRVDIRAATAELLCKMTTKRTLPAELAQTLENLKKDNRARVRIEAQGGWKESRKAFLEGASRGTV